MDIKKMITLCRGCILPNELCIPVQTSAFKSQSSTNMGHLAKDGGIALADYSPNGDLLCAPFSAIVYSDKSDNTPPSPSYGSVSLSDESFDSSNESLAEKMSSLSLDFTDSGNTSQDSDQMSFFSNFSNEAQAMSCFSSSHKDSSQSFNHTQNSILSFAECQDSWDGEGLAEQISSSSEEGNSMLNYFSGNSTEQSTPNSGSPVFEFTEEITRL